MGCGVVHLSRVGSWWGGGLAYLDGGSGNSLGGALDLEVGDDVCDLLERHVDVSCERALVSFF